MEGSVGKRKKKKRFCRIYSKRLRDTINKQLPITIKRFGNLNMMSNLMMLCLIPGLKYPNILIGVLKSFRLIMTFLTTIITIQN